MTMNTQHHPFTGSALIMGVQLILLTFCQVHEASARTLSHPKALYCGQRIHKPQIKKKITKKFKKVTKQGKRVTKKGKRVTKKVAKNMSNCGSVTSRHIAPHEHAHSSGQVIMRCRLLAGTFEIPADHPSLRDMQVRVHLYEYDPRRAGGKAKLIGALHIDGVTHHRGERTIVPLKLNPTEVPHPSRAHFLTVEGYQNDQNIYHGRPMHGGIGRVLTGGYPKRVRYIGQRLSTPSR